MIPPVAMGWYRRRKSAHFHEYCTLAEEFANAFSIDKWLICAPFRQVGGIDFKAHTGVEALAKAVDEVLENARKKHAQLKRP